MKRLAFVLLLACASCREMNTGRVVEYTLASQQDQIAALEKQIVAARDSLREERRKVAEMLDLLNYDSARRPVNDTGIEVRAFTLAGAVDSFGLAVPLRVDRLGRVVVAP